MAEATTQRPDLDDSGLPRYCPSWSLGGRVQALEEGTCPGRSRATPRPRRHGAAFDGTRWQVRLTKDPEPGEETAISAPRRPVDRQRGPPEHRPGPQSGSAAAAANRCRGPTVSPLPRAVEREPEPAGAL